MGKSDIIVVKDPKVIEFVCTGNQGRSKPCKILGEYRLIELGADKEGYRTISSGSHVDGIKSGNVSKEFMYHVISIAQQRGMFSDYDSAELLSAACTDLNDGDLGALDTVRGFYQRAADLFSKEELQYRAEVLPEFGINLKDLKEGQDQTVARPDTLAVLTMTNFNGEVVHRNYGGYEHQPEVIANIGEFVTGDPKVQVPNGYGKDIHAYRRGIEQLAVLVPQAVDKLLGV